MGISGLLPLLKSIQKPCNLKRFAGYTVGVDAYGWLHRGTVACAIDLALGKPTAKYVEFSLNRVRMLIHFGVTPYLVFDGDYLPSKAATETERAKRRDESRRAGLELYRSGKPSQAQKELQKAVDVTPEMAGQLIRELKKIGVQYVVAPYEADAQLAYLERKGIIQAVLSEDSDLLVFGVRCLLTKLDQFGDCVEINRKDFTSCRDISLVGWSDAEFRLMAILSGCDYLPSITNMGLLTAYRMVRKYKTIDKILRILQFDGKYHVPQGYLEAFQHAVLTFRHQRVFCPLSEGLAMATDPDPEQETDKLDFIGASIEPEIAIKVARGDLHPMTKKVLMIPRSASNKPGTPLGSTPKKIDVKFTDMKETKSIESFFKAKRTPLAELDPNRFTPSPSQRRLQQRASGSWLSSPAPRGSTVPLLGSQQHVTVLPAASPTQRHPQPSPIALPQTLKRRRLCSDSVNASSTSVMLENDEVSRSRFFPATPTQLSSNKAAVKRSRVKPAEINIWSDDSIEDVMAEIPEVMDRPVTKVLETSIVEQRNGQAQEIIRKGRSTEDVSATVSATFAAQQDSQNSTISESINLSEISGISTATIIEASSQILLQNVDNNVIAELATLKKTSIHVLEPKSVARQRNAVNLKVKPGEYQHVLANPAKPPMLRRQSCTPLQRLGASAMKRPQTCAVPIDGCKSRLDSDGPRLEMPAPRVPLSSTATEFGPMNGPDHLSINHGSEDLIVPDSEEDS